MFEFGQMCSNRLFEQRQARVGNQVVFVLPGLIVQKIIFKTAEADAIAAKDVTGFKAMTEQAIDQELIAIRQAVGGFHPAPGVYR